MQPALDGRVLDIAFGQGDVGVAAGVIDGVDVTRAVAHDRDQLAVNLRLHGTDNRQVVDGADTQKAIGPRRRVLCHVAGHAGCHGRRSFWVHADSINVGRPIDRESSVSIAAIRWSSTSVTPILLTMSAKKPRTTRRRASSWVMPRDSR